MMIQNITTEKRLEEVNLQVRINALIDQYSDFIFNAGAGSGKTYSLIESLRHILQTHGNRLGFHNQKVICITYTNVAVQEIRDRLGHSSLVEVSTIHEMLWSLIQSYQKQLVEIHRLKIEEELEICNERLYTSDDPGVFKVFRDLSVDRRGNFVGVVLPLKKLFYEYYDVGSKDFKEALSDSLGEFKDLLKNIANFKKIVSHIYKLDNYTKCLEEISKGSKEFQCVRYDSRYNSDILHRMLISHDTLLEYGYSLFSKYPLLNKVTIDTYPFILVDEYQDTNPYVVKILSCLSEYAFKINQKFVVGYYGDTAQNIYSDGVGSSILELHKNLVNVDKRFNRRSFDEIIDVANKIRMDGIVQTSIHDENIGGEVQFFQGIGLDKNTLVREFVRKCQHDWNISKENKLHCLVLTNRLVASLSGFGDYYNFFLETPFYKKNYDSINTELLSQDVSKLGKVPLVLYKLLKLKVMLSDSKTSLAKIVPENVYSKSNLSELKVLVSFLKLASSKPLFDFCSDLFDSHNNNILLLEVLSSVIKLESYSFSSLKSYFRDCLFTNAIEKADGSEEAYVDRLLSIPYDQLLCWFQFISGVQTGDVIYHTYHGTKGLEFDHVVIAMENDFGTKNRGMFSSYFKNVPVSNFNNDYVLIEKHEKTKNLLYVSCSRAKKNLRVLYLDEITDFKAGIEYIFGNIQSFPADNL